MKIIKLKKLYKLTCFVSLLYHTVEAKILSKADTIELIYDLEIIKEIAYRSDRPDSQQKAIFLQNKILLLKKFKISNSDLKETLGYYFANPTALLDIYKKVLQKLNENAGGQ